MAKRRKKLRPLTLTSERLQQLAIAGNDIFSTLSEDVKTGPGTRLPLVLRLQSTAESAFGPCLCFIGLASAAASDGSQKVGATMIAAKRGRR